MGEFKNPRGESPAVFGAHHFADIGSCCDVVDTFTPVESESLDSGIRRVAVDSDQWIGCIVDDPRHRFLQPNEGALDCCVTFVGWPRRIDLVLPVGREETLQCTWVLVTWASPTPITKALIVIDEIANRFPIADVKYEALKLA